MVPVNDNSSRTGSSLKNSEHILNFIFIDKNNILSIKGEI